MSKAIKQKSMYAQVVEILDSLQGHKIPSYQGLYAFWLNPDIFLKASLYGQRLIAPDEAEQKSGTGKSCCGSAKKSPAAESEIPSMETTANNDEVDFTASRSKLIPGSSKSPTTSAQNDMGCWPSGGSGGGGGGSDTGQKRSDRSAIIIGLKGKYPFDGTIFPRLLWDSDNIASLDQIVTIANWIDAGCPTNLEEENLVKSKLVESSNTVKLSNTTLLDLAHGKHLHKASAKNTNDIHRDVKVPTVRKEIHSLSPDELTTFREALSCMKQYNDYWQDERSFDYWARIHTNSCQHGWEQFLPWHRLYLYFFEQKLQDFDSSIALPYWSWTDYADVNTNTYNNSHYDLGIIPDAYGCYLDNSGLAKLKNAKASDGTTLYSAVEISSFEAIAKKGTVYQSGLRFLKAAKIKYDIVNENSAASWTTKIRVLYNVLNDVNTLWFPNRWPGSFGPLSKYPTKADMDLILDIDGFSDFGGGPAEDHYFGSLEKIHNGMHNFSGGTNPCYPDNNIDSDKKTPNTHWINKYKELKLGKDPQALENPVGGWMTDNRITAFDPLFWAHHSNVDRIWALWQEKHTGTPLDMDGALAPWSLGVSDAMSIQKLGYSYLRDSVFYPVSNKVGLVKFDSEPAQISSNTLETHRKAEIKIHRMQRGNLDNAVIRVFLNSPGANASTPTQGNDNFVEEIVTFHGSCYGGPGHCSLPLEKTRLSDHRGLHHHEPRNYKIDATQAVQRVLNNGAKNLTVQLVSIGINGDTAPDAVFVEGVSLNFMD